MKKNMTIVLLCLVLSIILGFEVYKSYNLSQTNDETPLSYEKYEEESAEIIKLLNEKYKGEMVIDENPSITSIPANVDNRWAPTQFDARSDNPATPLKKEFFIINKKLNLATKVGLYYNEKIDEKSFLSISRIDNYISDRLPDIAGDLPNIFTNTFSTKGILIQVTTFNLNVSKTESLEKDIDLKMINDNSKITRELEEIIIKFGSTPKPVFEG